MNAHYSLKSIALKKLVHRHQEKRWRMFTAAPTVTAKNWEQIVEN